MQPASMPLFHAFSSATLSVCLLVPAPAPPPGDPREPTAPPATAEAAPAQVPAASPSPVETPPTATSAPAASEATEPVAEPPALEPAAAAQPAPEAQPQSPPPAEIVQPPPSDAPLERVDAEALERMRKGQKLMNVSGIVMGSGAALLVVGTIATIVAGRAPNANDYEDIQAFQDDTEQYQRRAAAGGIITFVGALGVVGGAIAFAVGGAKYRRGKKASRRVSFSPNGTLRF